MNNERKSRRRSAGTFFTGMKTGLMALTVLGSTLVPAGAVFSEFVILDGSTYENGHATRKPLLRVNEKDPRFVDVKIPFSRGPKAYWLVTTTKPLAGKALNFRMIAWEQALPEFIQSFIRLGESVDRLASPNKQRGHIEFTIRKELLDRCYVYHDYERLVLDGGYYYTYDLSKHEVERGGFELPAPPLESKRESDSKTQPESEDRPQ